MSLTLLLVAAVSAMTLDEAKELAHARSPRLDLAEARVEEARAQKDHARSFLLPSVSAQGGAVWQNEVVADFRQQFYRFAQTIGVPVQPSDFSDVPDLLMQPGFSWQAGAEGQIPIVAPQAWALQEAARKAEALSLSEVEVERFQISSLVTEAWHASARAHAVGDAARRIVAMAERVDQLAESLVEYGVATRDQLLPGKEALASARAGLARAEAAAAAADEVLKLLTGAPGPADPIGEPGPVPEVASLLSGPAAHPDVEAARRRHEAAAAASTSASRARWPVLGVRAGAAWMEPEPYFADDINWQVGLGVQVPLYQGGRLNAQAREAAARAEQARAGRRALEEKAALEIIRAHGEARAAMASLSEREAAVELASQAVEAAEARLRDGGGSLLALQQAQASFALAELNLTTARADAARARDILDLVSQGR